MTFNVKVSGAWKETNPHVKVSGAWEPVASAWVKVSGVWKQFYTRFSVSVSPTAVSKFTGSTGTQLTGSVTVTVEGTGPFTYSWARFSGDIEILATSSTSATTTFQANLSGGDAFSTSFVCTVTDTSTGDTLQTDVVSVVIEHIS
jgi:hypothetical protein